MKVTIDMGKDENIVIEIPVKMTKALPRPKVGIDGQVTSFEVTGKNFDGASRAETTWRADWKKEPANVNAPISKGFDLSTPEDIVLFDKVSGGYDTGKAPKWNRNTLHCRSGQAECQKFPDYTGIKLRFTEQASQKTVDLNLRGNRHQTSTKDGRPTRDGALDVQTNPGGEAGVDAEVRFSVMIPKSELARLPVHGQWRAELIMDMKDANGKDLAVFSSGITLDVTDENDLSLKPPRIELLEGSHRDSNGSGGFTANDEFVYRITYVASRDLNGVNLELALPHGLDRHENLRHADGSVQELLSNNHGKHLLQHPVNLRQGQKLAIDVPLRIHPSVAARLVSQVHAHADGFDPLPSAEAVLNVQKRFDASESLGMTVEVIGQNAEEEPVIAQQTPLKYRIVLSSRKYALEGLSLAYRLPGGMQMNGKPELHPIPELAEVKLNENWNGDADIALFASSAKLSKEQSITIDIPVMVKEIVEDGGSVQSTFSAGAANLNGELSKSHKVRIRERESGGGHRVRIVKSVKGDAVALPGADIRYQIRVSNQTFKTVRNLLIRDRAPDHTTLIDASCGNLPDSACRVLKLGDKAVEEGSMTHAALCKGGTQSDPEGQHVFWCLDGDLEPLADYVVDYAVRINDGSAAVP